MAWVHSSPQLPEQNKWPWLFLVRPIHPCLLFAWFWVMWTERRGDPREQTVLWGSCVGQREAGEVRTEEFGSLLSWEWAVGGGVPFFLVDNQKHPILPHIRLCGAGTWRQAGEVTGDSCLSHLVRTMVDGFNFLESAHLWLPRVPQNFWGGVSQGALEPGCEGW